jgi:hypothetical protein
VVSGKWGDDSEYRESGDCEEEDGRSSSMSGMGREKVSMIDWAVLGVRW